MLKMHGFVKKVNVVRPICNHLLGEKHTHVHRMAVGFVIMAVGVCVAKSAHHFHYEIMHYLIDGVGYFIHGVGAAPYVEVALAIAANAGAAE